MEVNAMFEKKVFEKKEIMKMLKARGDEQKALHQRACEARNKVFGEKCFVRAVVEVTNVCRVNCSYCEMRRDNSALRRYVMSKKDILYAINEVRQSGIKTVMLQGGETLATTQLVIKVLEEINEKGISDELDIILYLGNKKLEDYKKLHQKGAKGYILKLETTNAHLHYQLRRTSLQERLDCLLNLRQLGYHVGTGIIAGLPGQDMESIVDDLYFIGQQTWSMCSVSPFIPPTNGDSNLTRYPPGDLDLTLNIIAILRLMQPWAVIPTVSALEMLAQKAQIRGLNAGANLVTINYTPEEFRPLYVIYNKNRFIVGLEHAKQVIAAAGMRMVHESSLGPVILPDSLVKAFFEEKWRESGKEVENSIYNFENPLMKEILSDGVSGRVCDVGCGDGRFAIEFAKKGCRVLAIDFSRSALERLIRRAKRHQVAERIETLNRDVRRLSLRSSDRFDLIVIANMLHYLSPLEVIHLLTDLVSHMPNGGKMYIALETDIEMKYDQNRYFTFAGQFNHSPERLRLILQKLDLKVKKASPPIEISAQFSLPSVVRKRLETDSQFYTRAFKLYEFLALKE
jgi:biotin synthase